MSKDIPLPERYADWEHVLLDIVPGEGVDIVGNALELEKVGQQFDGVYSSHVLEHVHPWNTRKVLRGMHGVLIDGGSLEVHVPEVDRALEIMIDTCADLMDIAYHSAAGAITFHDIIYGFGPEIRNGSSFMEHKQAFSEDRLILAVERAGFKVVDSAVSDTYDLAVFAVK